MHQDTSRPDRKGPAPVLGPGKKRGGHTEPAKKGDGFPSNFLVGAMLAICFCSHSGKQKTTTSQNPKSVAPGFQRKMKPKQPSDKALSSKPHPFFFPLSLACFVAWFLLLPGWPPPRCEGRQHQDQERPGIWTIAWLGKNRQLTRRYRRCPDLGKDGTFQHITQRQQKSQKKMRSLGAFWWI